MKVKEIWVCALRHLNFCKRVLESESVPKDEGTLVELYYLLGYVFECFAVYIAYSIDYRVENSTKKVRWPAEKDIKEFDYCFSNRTKLAFKKDYRSIIETNARLACQDAKERKVVSVNDCVDMKNLESCINAKLEPRKYKPALSTEFEEKYKEFKRSFENMKIRYAVSDHSFNKTTGFVDHLIRKNLPTAVDPSVGPIPYFSDDQGYVTPEQRLIISNWSTGLRYNFSNPGFNLTSEVLLGLVSICERINVAIPHYITCHTGKKNDCDN